MITDGEKKIDPRDSTENDKDDQKELPPENGTEAVAEEAEVEMEGDFDPETADRLSLLGKYKELEEELQAARDKVLRSAADAENFKKRLQREKDEQTRYANEAYMRDLLPVIDNLERALEHSETGSGQGGLVEGLKMTLRGFVDTLARFGCDPVKAVGETFDPNFHEAVSQEESAEYEANTVLRELQKGYTLKKRLLRPAMVVVSKGSSPEDSITQEEDTGESTKADSREVKIKIKKA